MLSVKETYKRIFSEEICSIIIRESSRKGRMVVFAHNNKQLLKNTYKLKMWTPLTYEELETFLGLLILAGIYHNERVTVHEMCLNKSHPIFRASMNLSRFLALLSCMRVDNINSREERRQLDKACCITDKWNMLQANLQSNYTSSEELTVDEQLFPFRGGTLITLYIPSKPAKYGRRVFNQTCDPTL